MSVDGKRQPDYETAIELDVDSGGAFVSFLYLLLRDHLSAGVVEEIVAKVEDSPPPYAFANDWVAGYAVELNSRLSGISEDVAREATFTLMKNLRSDDNEG